MSFDDWMSRIDEYVQGAIGFSTRDLPAFDYRSAYDDELEPADVARQLLDENFDV